MTVIDVLALPVEQAEDLSTGGPDRYDYSRLPEHLRTAAMHAQGTVVEGLTSAVRRVLDAGQVLAWAKSELPHGEYLPWVQLACGLKPGYAQKLIKAAEWANAEHVPLLRECTDVATLFILSADTTTEEVREWFMERCAAGDPPTRKEVQERKHTAGQPRAPQPAETLALSILRKGEMDRIREALTLAERAQAVTADQVMAEQRLRELGKQRFIAGADADFHRMKDGGWIRLPHAGRVDIATEVQPVGVVPAVQAANAQCELINEAVVGPAEQRVSITRAAQILDCSETTIKQRLSPKQIAAKGPWKRNGYVATKGGTGIVVIQREP